MITEDKKNFQQVVAAVIIHDNHFLIAQRGESQSFSQKWEFPGGKVETGENFHDALVREIREELDVKIKVLKKIGVEYCENNSINIAVNYFYSKIEFGTVKLIEHSDFRWVKNSQFKEFDFIEGDKNILSLII